MMAGVEAGFDAAFMVGYHARAGTAHATLAHTYLFAITDVVVCGGPDGDLAVGELGLNAAVAGAFGAPLAFASGDDKLVAEARALVPGVERSRSRRGSPGRRPGCPDPRRRTRPCAPGRVAP